MKYLKVEVEGASEQAEWWATEQAVWRATEQATWPSRAMWPNSNLRSNPVSDLRCLNPDAMCSGLELELCWLTDLRCSNARSVCWLVLQCWLRCSVDVFVFRFALVIFDLVICNVNLVLVFFFFWEYVSLLYLFTICWFVFFV